MVLLLRPLHVGFGRDISCLTGTDPTPWTQELAGVWQALLDSGFAIVPHWAPSPTHIKGMGLISALTSSGFRGRLALASTSGYVEN